MKNLLSIVLIIGSVSLTAQAETATTSPSYEENSIVDHVDAPAYSLCITQGTLAQVDHYQDGERQYITQNEREGYRFDRAASRYGEHLQIDQRIERNPHPDQVKTGHNIFKESRQRDTGRMCMRGVESSGQNLSGNHRAVQDHNRDSRGDHRTATNPNTRMGKAIFMAWHSGDGGHIWSGSAFHN